MTEPVAHPPQDNAPTSPELAQARAHVRALQQEEAQAREHDKHLLGLAAVGSALAGFVSAGTQVWREFYSEMRHRGAVKEYLEERHAAQDKAITKTMNRTYPETRQILQEIDTKFHDQFNQITRSMGLESGGVLGTMKGTVQRLGLIGERDALRVAGAGFVTSIVAMGFAYNILHNRRMARAADLHQAELAAKLDEQEQQRSSGRM